MDKKVELLPHNEEAYEKLIECLKTNQMVSINHATGTGKSFIILKYLYEFRNKRILYLAPTYQIIDQLVNEHTKELGITKEEFSCFDTMIYSNLLSKNLDELKDKYDIIILDEYHRCGARKWGKRVNELLKKVKETNKDMKVIGTTATEIRYLDNNRNMNNIIFDGVCASRLTLADAILKGILPAPIYVNFNFDLLDELTLVYKRIKKIVIYENDLEKYIKLYNEIREEVEKEFSEFTLLKEYLNDSGKYLVFSSTKDQINNDKKFISKILGNKKKEYVITSFNTPSKNNQILSEFRNSSNDINQVLYSINILNEGVHVKNVDAIFMFRRTSSPIIYFQQLGRLLSYSRRNDKVVLFDLVDNLKNHPVIYKLYLEVSRRTQELIKTDPENKDRYQKIIDTFKIVDRSAKIVEKVEKFKELTKSENLYLERLKTAVNILENQNNYDYPLIIQAYVDISKLEDYITIDLYDRISKLNIDKPKIFSFSREYFITYLNGYSSIYEKKTSQLNDFVKEIMIFYDNNFHLPSIFSPDESEKELADKLLSDFRYFSRGQKSKIKKYVDDDLSIFEQITYGKNNFKFDFLNLYKELDFIIANNIIVGEEIFDLLSIENTKESLEYINKLLKNNATYYISEKIEEDDKLKILVDDEKKEINGIPANVLYLNSFENINKKVTLEFNNDNQEEYLLNLTNQIIEFIKNNQRIPSINGQEFEKELFFKRIILKTYLEKYGYENKINEVYLNVQLNLKKMKKGLIYKKIIEFMELHEGELPNSKSMNEDERKLAIMYKTYYNLFTDEEKGEIKLVVDKYPKHHLIVIKNYINFIKKYKRRPLYNKDNQYELKLYESFVRIEEYLTSDERFLIDEVLGRISKYKETRFLYQEMLSKKGKR